MTHGLGKCWPRIVFILDYCVIYDDVRVYVSTPRGKSSRLSMLAQSIVMGGGFW